MRGGQRLCPEVAPEGADGARDETCWFGDDDDVFSQPSSQLRDNVSKYERWTTGACSKQKRTCDFSRHSGNKQACISLIASCGM